MDTNPSESDASATGRIVFHRSQDGLRLAARVFDADGAKRPPLLCLPGLSRNSRDFLRLGEFFSRHPIEPRKVVALDYRGRGLSEADPDWRNYTPLIEAQDVMAAAAMLGIEESVLVGTSRGGIIAMLLGALRPGLIAGVVLNDIGPVIESAGLARIRTYLTTKRSVSTWDAAVALVRESAGARFPALTDADWRAFAEAYFAPTEAGALEPQYDPNLARSFSGGAPAEQTPALWPQFESLASVPVLAIRGEYSDILSAPTLREMAARHPDFEQLTVRGQGHPPLLRDLRALEKVLAFARRCEPPARP